MTPSDLLTSFDWKLFREETGDTVEVLLGAARMGGGQVDLVMEPTFRSAVRLDSDALQSAVLPLKVLQRQLRLALASIALDAATLAGGNYEWLATLAERRGDVAGADAWRTVVEAIGVAKAAAAKAVAQQTWDVDE